MRRARSSASASVRRAALASLHARGVGHVALEHRPCVVGKQRLSTASEGHEARGDRYGESTHLPYRRTARDAVRGVAANRHLADMKPNARREPERAHRRLIVERVACHAHRRLEHHEDSIRARDLEPAVPGKEVTGAPVVRGPQLRGTRRAEPGNLRGAVLDVGEHERPHAFGSGIQCDSTWPRNARSRGLRGRSKKSSGSARSMTWPWSMNTM